MATQPKTRPAAQRAPGAPWPYAGENWRELLEADWRDIDPWEPLMERNGGQYKNVKEFLDATRGERVEDMRGRDTYQAILARRYMDWKVNGERIDNDGGRLDPSQNTRPAPGFRHMKPELAAYLNSLTLSEAAEFAAMPLERIADGIDRYSGEGEKLLALAPELRLPNVGRPNPNGLLDDIQPDPDAKPTAAPTMRGGAGGGR